VLGVGVDAFGIAYPRYRDPRYWEIEFGSTPNKAHNEPIQILAAQGIVGGIAALAVIVLVALAAFRAIARKESAVRGGAIAASASLVAFAAQDLMSFTVAALGCLAAAMAGWLSSAAWEAAPRKRERVPLWAFGLALIPVAFLFAAFVLLPLRAQLQEKKAMKAPLGSPDRAWALTRAARYAPWDAWYENLLGNSLLVQSGSEPDPGRKRELLRQAAQAIRSAIATEPENPYLHSSLGKVATAQAALRPPDATEADARRAFDEALRRDPVNAQVMDQESDALLLLGRVPEARTLSMRSIAIYPELAQPMAVFGYIALLDKRWSDARDTLELAARREWFGENVARAATWSNLSAAYLALGQNQEALHAAEEGLSFDPRNPDARANRDLARMRLERSSR
jgi:tetratricopeptide (TPR) repeat protein